MRRRSRTRRVLKWMGLVACLVTVLVFLSSLVWSVGFCRLADEGRESLSIGTLPGELAYVLGRYYVACPQTDEGLHVAPASEFMWTSKDLLASPVVKWTVNSYGAQSVYVSVPLWFVSLVFAIPTAILWYLDRRPPKGHCQKCGYNLTGNVSGVCPECGHSI
ncbi:MAG: hypothetical protein JXB13_08480 [Phycisphaerae bacterium]|nr:hypothetical protein [Phycisphaerae bacterium]